MGQHKYDVTLYLGRLVVHLSLDGLQRLAIRVHEPAEARTVLRRGQGLGLRLELRLGSRTGWIELRLG